MSRKPSVLVTGGAGYIGCVLVPKLLATHRVVVLDALWFGAEGFRRAVPDGEARLVEGDVRDTALVESLLRSERFDAVVHLAAVANDPCAELDPELTESVNLGATRHLLEAAKREGVSRFLYASSASVYGISEAPEVTEDLPLDPLTIYARTKVEGEGRLRELADDSFVGVAVRSATVCGYSPRPRLDLTINILTHAAIRRGKILVFGGEQSRPNVHVEDLAELYRMLLDADPAVVNGQAFNVVTSNATVAELAAMVRSEIDPALPIEVVPTEDRRSYRLSGARLARELGFRPKVELATAVRELRDAFADGRIPDPDDVRHRNVEVMKRAAKDGRIFTASR